MGRNGTGSREKVLEAARELFLQRGYQATSMDQILEEAGVSPSNFYYHFKGKEELAREVIESYMTEVRDEMRPVLGDAKLSPRKKLEGLHRYFLESMIQSDCCGG